MNRRLPMPIAICRVPAGSCPCSTSKNITPQNEGLWTSKAAKKDDGSGCFRESDLNSEYVTGIGLTGFGATQAPLPAALPLFTTGLSAIGLLG
jgi:hypothetical protein